MSNQNVRVRQRPLLDASRYSLCGNGRDSAPGRGTKRGPAPTRDSVPWLASLDEFIVTRLRIALSSVLHRSVLFGAGGPNEPIGILASTDALSVTVSASAHLERPGEIALSVD
jgi:hypothetical protein